MRFMVMSPAACVTSRKGRVSRNILAVFDRRLPTVTSRKGRVSRNDCLYARLLESCRHVPQGACE